MGENHFAAAPTALYGAILLMAGIAYMLLQNRIIASQGPDSALRKAVAGDWKGKLSVCGKLHWVALGLHVLVAAMWLVPDRRAASALNQDGD